MLMDLVDTPIRVTSIDPGLAETEFSVVRFSGDTERAGKVYQGITALSGDDVADAIIWAASRPDHVQIAQMTILATNQGGAMVVHRKG
jgi:NADP-dependent 3-hydroxy acid dehydrogenase YdfG